MKLPRYLRFLEHEIVRHIAVVIFCLWIFSSSISYYFHVNLMDKLSHSEQALIASHKSEDQLQVKLAGINKELQDLKNVDQTKRNDALEVEIKNIQTNYKKAETDFEVLSDFKTQTKKDWPDLDTLFAKSLQELSDKKYSDASKDLDTLSSNIQTEKDKITAAQLAAAPPVGPPATQTNNPPDSGYQRISVGTPSGNFTVDIVSADLGSTKVIVDTASDSDCGNNCPVMPLGNYASRSGAYAAIAGPYFCPTAYPSCAGKTNSFDTLLLGKNKHYFNSDNNVYSTIPAAIFSGSARFVSQSLQWGRDTSPDSVIANYPLLVSGNNIVYSGSGDAKLNSKGSRGFIANKGNKVYIGYVLGADTGNAAQVMKALGMENALNLDEGGSTALWVGGRYIEGPGRDLPFGVLFVKR